MKKTIIAALFICLLASMATVALSGDLGDGDDSSSVVGFSYPDMPGLQGFIVQPADDPAYRAAIASPQTREVKSVPGEYWLSYPASLMDVSFEVEISYQPGFREAPYASGFIYYDLRYEIWRADPATLANALVLSGTAQAGARHIPVDSSILARDGIYTFRIFLPSPDFRPNSADGSSAQIGKLSAPTAPYDEWHEFKVMISRLYDISVLKTDTQGRPLAGATIGAAMLSTPTANLPGGTASYSAVTNSSGIAILSLPAGRFAVSETQAPAGYTKDDTVHEVIITVGTQIFTVSIDGVTDHNPDAPMITIVNRQSAITITANKRDENGAPLAGATLRMTGENSEGVARVYSATSNSSGVATFSVEPGRYILSEYAAPAGYNATSDRYDILVTETIVFDMTGITGNQNPPPYQPVTFVNRLIPVLNKDDHFAYMQGYPEGTFGPSRNMSRAEAVVMFSRLLNETMNMTTNYYANYYPDIVSTNWFANQVCYMHHLGVLEDYCRDERFRPNEPVTRAEFATLAAHFDNLTLTDSNVFSDVPGDHWAVKYINSAAAKGWIQGYTDGTFKPEANITRAEVVTLVNRILERSADGAYIAANLASLPRSYSDINATHWAYLDVMEASIGHDYVKDGPAERWTAVYA